ncbi:hypothetical protein IMCC3317_08080 [Kordia antarctica]|uniref:DUF2061 domain-containing protein n=1 Tax=Kordia antarctica TaxID=1218801 RepID=A0A7L4ZFL6_9FLAO|nr:DUF2061 domain-containing protein [Kordia antarctica]QHI35462.1 hypothetical protein IMCC3317_08080 [Kordia antarctica]
MKDISKRRHIVKTITWRILASITTFLLAILFFKEDSHAVEKALGIALTESVLKMILYYYHERFWYKSNFGLTSRSSRKIGNE